MSLRVVVSVLALTFALAAAGCAPSKPSGTARPDSVDPGAAREADRLYAAGVAAARAGAFAKAAAHFQGSLAADPARIETRYNLGLALMETGELVEATSFLAEVSRARPDHAETRYAHGSALRRRDLHAQALEEFQAALRADGKHAKAAYAYAKTLDDLHRPDAARDAWQRFLDRFPKDPRVPEARQRLASPPPPTGGTAGR